MADDGKEFATKRSQGVNMVLQVYESFLPAFFNCTGYRMPFDTIADSVNVAAEGRSVGSGVYLYSV